MKNYPTITIEAQDYGWRIKCWEITEGESEELGAASEANDHDKVLGIIAGLIIEWNCTDREGNELPTTVEGLKRIPRSVLTEIITGMAAGKATMDPNSATA